MPLRPLLFLLILIGIPYLEIIVFFRVGDVIGGWTAFALTLLSAFIGIGLIRLQGLDVIRRMQEQAARGEPPVKEIGHGFLLLVAGFFFLLPGFITDSFALLISLPPLRHMIINSVFRPDVMGRFQQNRTKHNDDETIIIEGEFHENTPSTPPHLTDKSPDK